MAVYTIGDIAKRFGVEHSRVRYIITKRGIEPVGRAGAYRLFNDAAANRIAIELAAIDRKKREAVRS